MEAAWPLQRCHDVMMRFLTITDFDLLTPEVVGELLAAFSSVPEPQRDARCLAGYKQDLEKLREQLLRFEEEALVRRERLLREHRQLAAITAWNKNRSETY